MAGVWIAVLATAAIVGGIIFAVISGNKKKKNKTDSAGSSPSDVRAEAYNQGPAVTPQNMVLVPEIDDDDFYDEKTIASFDDVTVPVEDDDDDKTLPFFMEEKPQHKVILTRCSDGYRIECTGDLFSVGKSLNSSNYMIPGSQKISRLHATFYERDGNYFIVDNSKNGTTVNGVAVPKTQQMPVSNGDKIRFADVEFTFNIE